MRDVGVMMHAAMIDNRKRRMSLSGAMLPIRALRKNSRLLQLLCRARLFARRYPAGR